MSFKKPRPQLWQVWVMGSDAAGTYWLAKACKSAFDAFAYYQTCRADYLKAELKAPMGEVVESHSSDIEPLALIKVEILQLYGVTWLEWVQAQ